MFQLTLGAALPDRALSDAPPGLVAAAALEWPAMAVRIDLAERRLTCSVHDLLPDVARRSVGGGGEGLSRLTVGAELHRVIQTQRAAADPLYVPEVSVDTTVEVDGWTLRILGRADAVTRSDAVPVVEEIKTLHFRTELDTLFSEDRLERHRWQLRLYAYCLFPEGDARARLVYVDLGGDRQRDEEVAWSPAEVAAYLRSRVHALVAAERERERVRAVWREAAADLPFPFAEPRPVQREAMAAVDESLGAGRHLLLAAPTGVGKTAAALYPAVRLALATGRRVVFLTAKTLQQQLAVETLRKMQRSGWHSIQLRAKAKMCANAEVICHEEFCAHARDYGVKLAQRGVLPALLDASAHLDPDRTFAVADAAEVCPFEVSLELRQDCSAVVCDYNYVFDPRIALYGLGAEGTLEDAYLVIDEAHNLVDRAREYYSPQLTRSDIAEARDLVDPFPNRVCREIDAVLQALDELVANLVESGLGDRTGAARSDGPGAGLSELRIELDALIAPYFTFKRNQDLWLADDPVVRILLAVARTAELLEDGGSELIPLVERDDRGERFRILCVDASRFVGRIVEASAGCVAMSATLEPFDFYRDLLGFDPDRTDTVALPSPFPEENRLVLAVDDVDTSYRFRSAAYGRIAELVAELAPPDRNGLVLFPSYAFLRQVADRLEVTTHAVVIQRGGDSDRIRRDILARLRANDEPVLLLAVLGGVYAEGVDYPGDMLSAVVVVSPALPQVGPERELLKAYFAERYERGFEYAYLVPGMRRVVQAAGRLIRSDSDRGVIALVCRRFLREPYVSMLPREWSGATPETLRHADPGSAVRTFFAGEGP